MMIAGLKNISAKSQANQAKESRSSAKGKSAFEDFLGTASEKKSPARAPASDKAPVEKAPAENPEPKAKATSTNAKSNNSAPVKDQPTNAEADTLPPASSAPSLGAPLPTERLSMTPVNAPPSVPLAKVTSPQVNDENVDSLTRRVVWNDFLRKMKDELGISPEDVLDAFASLPPEELAKPPQQSVDQIVMALGLNGEQAATAKQYLNELIQKTQPRSMGEELTNSKKQISLTLMSERELQRKTLQRSLDQMNQNFFMNGPKDQKAAQGEENPLAAMAAAPQGPQAATAQTAPTEMKVTEWAPQMESATPEIPVPIDAPAAAPVETAPTTPLQQTAKPMSASPAAGKKQALNDLNQSQMPAVTEARPKDENALVEALTRKFMMTAEPKAQPMAAAAAAAPTVMAKAEATPHVMPQPALDQMISGLGLAKDDSTSEDGDFTSDASYLTQGFAPEMHHLSPEMKAEFKTQLAQMAPNSPVSIPDLVDRAQIMVHDGGGEMKVTLSPDGLGEVAMRVGVENGKVSVQMITESDEAKKLIERELHSLKSSLHSNHLSIDTIKVDTASNLGKQLDQQYQDAQRQAAQQSLEQFRQDNQGWRRSFFEVPSAKYFSGQGEASRDQQAPVQASSSRKTGSRRLDLVA